jgi:hypothetical protein
MKVFENPDNGTRHTNIGGSSASDAARTFLLIMEAGARNELWGGPVRLTRKSVLRLVRMLDVFVETGRLPPPADRKSKRKSKLESSKHERRR